jgi:hypothetical protein
MAGLAECGLGDAQEQVVEGDVESEIPHLSEQVGDGRRPEVGLHGAVHRDHVVMGAADVAGDAVEIVIEQYRRREELEDAVIAVPQVASELLQPGLREFVDQMQARNAVRHVGEHRLRHLQIETSLAPPRQQARHGGLDRPAGQQVLLRARGRQRCPFGNEFEGWGGHEPEAERHDAGRSSGAKEE